jgi:membrane protease YdiL (CAAX protease family)
VSNASEPAPHRSLSIGSAILLTAAIFFVLQLAGVAAVFLRAVSQGITLGRAEYAIKTDPVTLGALHAAVMGAAVFALMRFVGKDSSARTTLWVRAVPKRLITLCLVGGASMQLPLAELSNVVQERWPIPIDAQLVQHALLTPDTWVDGFGAVFAFALIAPVGEELFFRGLLLPGLSRRYGSAPAIFATAMLFGVVHYGFPATVVPAAVAGLVLGALTAQTGSILPAIAAHVGNNAIVLLLPERLVRIEGLNTIGEDVYHLDPWLVAGAMAAMVACFGLVILSARDARER